MKYNHFVNFSNHLRFIYFTESTSNDILIIVNFKNVMKILIAVESSPEKKHERAVFRSLSIKFQTASEGIT